MFMIFFSRAYFALNLFTSILFGISSFIVLEPLYKSIKTNFKMYLRYYLNENGERQYTLATIGPNGKPTLSAHPARFSPEDKYSRQRITIKKRFGLLLTQQPEPIH